MKILRYTLLLFTLASAVVWSSRARRTVVSDDELAQIFHDAFLSNAFVNDNGIDLDSLKLYEPIFQRYGYTTEDVQYTIGSFATRKVRVWGMLSNRRSICLKRGV